MNRNKILAILFFVLAVVLIFGGLFINNIGYEVKYREAPCVDGNQDMNLEGIMCNQKYYTFFGEEDSESILMIVMIVGILLSLLFGMVYLIKSIDDNN